MNKNMKLRGILAAAALALVLSVSAWAGPPFMTDDPVPESVF
jgi:hypothetical protein